MNAKCLNTIGLVFGIIGVVLIFFWGYPQPSFDTGVSLGLEPNNVIDAQGTTVAQHNIQVIADRERYVIISRIGLAFVGLGFLCQLVALFLHERLPQAPASKTTQ
jgi:hypothetical protein